MSNRLTIGLGVLASWLALGTACQTSNATPPGSSYGTWHDLMENEIDPAYSEFLYPETEKEPGAMDFDGIAARARRAASYMAMGYGEFAGDDERFARWAREAEQWLLEIASQAELQNGELVRDLIRVGESKHCDRCHDAFA